MRKRQWVFLAGDARNGLCIYGPYPSPEIAEETGKAFLGPGFVQEICYQNTPEEEDAERAASLDPHSTSGVYRTPPCPQCHRTELVVPGYEAWECSHCGTSFIP